MSARGRKGAASRRFEEAEGESRISRILLRAKDGGGSAADVSHRVRLIGDLSKLICEGDVPEPMRTAGLALIGYLARRFPGEAAHQLGVAEARRCIELELEQARVRRSRR